MVAICSYTNHQLYLEAHKWLVREMVDGRERRQLDRIWKECLKRNEKIWDDAIEDATTTSTNVTLFDLFNIVPEVMTVKRLDHYEIGAISSLVKLGAGASPVYPITGIKNPEYFDDVKPNQKENFSVIRISGESMINAKILPGHDILVKNAYRADDLDIIVARLDGSRIVKTYSIDDDGERWLYSENDRFPFPMRVGDYADFEIEGIVLRRLENIEHPRKRALNTSYH